MVSRAWVEVNRVCVGRMVGNLGFQGGKSRLWDQPEGFLNEGGELLDGGRVWEN